MQIHLSRPGGHREGPFSVDEINRDLASRKYSDSDYWAWYEGLESWIPLHSVPGVRVSAHTEIITRVEEEHYAIDTEVDQPYEQTPDPVQPLAEETSADQADEPAAEMPEAAAPRSNVYSGMPADALENIFVFTTGQGPSLRESAAASMMLLEIIGDNPDAIRDRVPRDVFGQCNIGERIRVDGKIPASAWRAISSLRPEVVQKAKEGLYRTCVRTFTTELNDVVAVFLFYSKERLP